MLFHSTLNHRLSTIPSSECAGFARDSAKVEDQVRFLARTFVNYPTLNYDTELPFELETDLERLIAAQPRWQHGIDWGRPRHGHPEGTIKLHIAAVLANIDRLFADDPSRSQLRLIALIHDAFKGEVDTGEPRIGENHHAMRARRFAEPLISDAQVLDVIELHDHAFNAWKHCCLFFDWTEAETRASNLLVRLGGALALYLRFYQCDNETEGKDQACFTWFRDFVNKTNTAT